MGRRAATSVTPKRNHGQESRFTIFSSTKILTSTALGLAVACLAPAAGQASEVAIPAAGCTQVAVPEVDTVDARSGGGFATTAGASASLICAVPTDELDSSSGGDDDDDDDSGRLTFRVAFLDGDSTATGATVSVQLFRTTLAAGDTGPVVDTAVCGAWTPCGVPPRPARPRPASRARASRRTASTTSR